MTTEEINVDEEENDKTIQQLEEDISKLTNMSVAIKTIKDDTELEDEFTPPPQILDKSKQKGMGFIGKPITGYQTNAEEERIAVLDQTKRAYIDLTQSIVIIAVGTRGSGKSYSDRILGEEILLQNPYVAIITIDKMGVYFTEKYPNTNKDEFQGFEEVEPMGFPNHVVVYIPACDIKKIPKGTYDRIISLRPNQVPFDAWCQIFDWELMSPQARCMKRAINITEQNQMDNYSLIDIMNIIDGFDNYKESTKEAVINKLDFAVDLKLFNSEGITLSDIVYPNIHSIIDVSQSGDKVAQLLTAFFAEALYQERKRIDLELKHKELGEIEGDIDETKVIPPTFLILEEFHTYLPRVKGKSVSSEGLMKYIKEGRGVGLSFIGISQEPSLINTTALRQLSVLLIHNLTTDEEIKATLSILPCPADKKKMALEIKTLTTGQAFYCMKGPREPLKIQVRTAKTIHLARSDNTEIFKGISDRKLIKKAFKVFQGHANLSRFKHLDQKNSSLVQQIEGANNVIRELKEQINKVKGEKQKEIDKINEDLTKTTDLLIKTEELVKQQKEKIRERELKQISMQMEYDELLKEKGVKDKKIDKIKTLQKEIDNKNKKLKEKEQEIQENTGNINELIQISNELKNKLEKVTKEKNNLLEKNIKISTQIQQDGIYNDNQEILQNTTKIIAIEEPNTENVVNSNGNGITSYLLDEIDKTILKYLKIYSNKNISIRQIMNSTDLNTMQIRNSLKKLVKLKKVRQIGTSNYYRYR
jgi:hypothetical protein